MSLKTLAGKLLLTAAKKLAAACQCCIDKFCCVPYGPPDECGNRDTSCQPCSGGAYDEPTCSDECPERPPCSTQCVQVGTDACGQPIYECQYTTEDAGIACSEAAPCPTPPPCPDKYYCCYSEPPSLDPNSPLPSKSCQVGPCSSPELNAGGPYDTQQQCEAACVPPPCSGPCDAENPCGEGCACVDGQCVEQDCATQGCPPAQIEGNTLTRQCCGKFHFNPALPQEEQFQSGECFPGYFALSFCIPSECSIEQYLNFEAGCEITAGIYFGDTCPDGCPEGSKCITVNSCPGA